MGKMMEVNLYGTTYKVGMHVASYQNNGNLAIQLYCEETEDDETYLEPFATLTVNTFKLKGSNACVDVNNCPWAPEMISKYGIGKYAGADIPSGFCVYPIYEFDLEKLKEYEV